MHLVMAIVRPVKLDEVRLALSQLGIGGMTVTEVLGFGRQQRHAAVDLDVGNAVRSTPKIKIEVVIDDGLLDQVVETLQRTARTGHVGDGKIVTAEIGSAIRIRTGEVDLNAI